MGGEKILIFLSAYIFIMGLLVGSFLNVCIYRIPAKKSIIYPPSACPVCENRIKWYDNIPIVSYLVLRGKCRYCNEKISKRYPLIELLTGIMFLLFFLKFGLVKIYFFYIIIVGYMITLTFIDFDRKIVPDRVIVLLFITGYMLNSLEIADITIFSGIIGALCGGLILFFLNFFSNGKVGDGDVKLITALGFCVGVSGILNIILYSFILGGITGLILLMLKKYGRKDEMAFVPFVAAAFMIETLL